MPNFISRSFKMTKIALAGFLHETNTFSPYPTTYEDFTTPGGPFTGFLKGDEIFSYREKRVNIGASGCMKLAAKKGWEIVPLFWTFTEPAGLVTDNAFERLMGMIAAGLSEQGPYDGVYLDLHGAMVYGDYQDGETEILRRVRAIVGDVPIIASHDLHGNVSEKSIEISSAIVGFRTYPHVDMYETGERGAQVMEHLLAGKSLFKAYRQVPFLMPLSKMPTTIDPGKSVYAEIEEVEKMAGVVSGTIMEGFPPADIEHAGPTVFTYATNQLAADAAADHLYQTILEREAEFGSDLPDPDDAVLQAIELSKTADKPVVIADVQDNSGGGGTSDTTGVLRALIRHDADAALALMYDPDVAAIAHEAGEGAEISVDLGGKLFEGDSPLRGRFVVEKLVEGPFKGSSPMMRGFTIDLGKMAQLRTGNVRIVVSSHRTQALDREYFRRVGIIPEDMKILVVKSSNHYRADFEPIASTIINVDAPAAIIDDPSKIDYKNLRAGVRLKGLGPVSKKKA
jgi:microcystin degradation protein MlrC